MNINQEFYETIGCGALLKQVHMAQDPAHFVQLLFKAFPPEQFWRFSIDGYRQTIDSWPGFEQREQGYLQGMYQALLAMLGEINTPANVQMLRHYHLLATTDVQMEKLSVEYKGNWRDEDVSFELRSFMNATINGILALFDKMERGDDTFVLTCGRISNQDYDLEISDWNIINSNTYKYVLNSFATTRGLDPNSPEAKQQLAGLILGREYSFRTQQRRIFEVSADRATIESIHKRGVSDYLQEKVAQCIRFHYEQMKSENDCNQTLSIIVRTIQSLEQLHPFKDANCRIFVMVMLNKFLLENGLPPCILDEPNCFDAFSEDELISSVKTGMNRFQEIFLSDEKSNIINIKIFDPTMTAYFKKINDNFLIKMQEILQEPPVAANTLPEVCSSNPDASSSNPNYSLEANENLQKGKGKNKRKRREPIHNSSLSSVGEANKEETIDSSKFKERNTEKEKKDKSKDVKGSFVQFKARKTEENDSQSTTVSKIQDISKPKLG